MLYVIQSDSLFNLFVLKEKSPDLIQMMQTLPPLEDTSTVPAYFSPALVPLSLSVSNLSDKSSYDPVEPLEPGNISYHAFHEKCMFYSYYFHVYLKILF